MKFPALFLIVLSSTPTFAQQTLRPDGNGGFIVDSGPCSGMSGFGKGECEAKQDRLQQKLQEQQIENQRLQNELLRKQIEKQDSEDQKSAR